MTIIDLTEKYENSYCMCLEEWSDEMKEAGGYKKSWLEKKKKKGLRVKLALNEEKQPVGMIHYVPIEEAPVMGKDLYYVYCIWVHGYKEGVGNYQNRGIGRELLKAAEEDVKALGSKGLVAWGITLPFFMRSKWFKKNGYKSIDRNGISELVWKPFSSDTEPPRMIKQSRKPDNRRGEVNVTCFRDGWCPSQNLVCERMKRVIEDTGRVAGYTEIDTEDRDNLMEWGISDALYIDSKLVNTGRPPSYDALKKKLEKALNKKGLV